MTGQPYWVDSSGKAWTASTIKDSHLVNILNLLKRKGVWADARAMWLLYLAVERDLTDKLVGFDKELKNFEKGKELMGKDHGVEEVPLSSVIKTRTRKEAEAAKQARKYFGQQKGARGIGHPKQFIVRAQYKMGDVVTRLQMNQDNYDREELEGVLHILPEQDLINLASQMAYTVRHEDVAEPAGVYALIEDLLNRIEETLNLNIPFTIDIEVPNPMEEVMNDTDRIAQLEAELAASKAQTTHVEGQLREERSLVEKLKAGGKRTAFALGAGASMNRIYAAVRKAVDSSVDRMGDGAPELAKTENGKQMAVAAIMWGLMMSEEFALPIPKVGYVAKAGELGMMKVGDVGMQNVVSYVYENFGDIMFSLFSDLAEEGQNMIEDKPDFQKGADDLASQREPAPLREAKQL
jgi:hypothetical protein